MHVTSIWINQLIRKCFDYCYVVRLYLLTKGGDILSDHCSNLANSIGVPSVVVGLTIVSVATSAPELSPPYPRLLVMQRD